MTTRTGTEVETSGTIPPALVGKGGGGPRAPRRPAPPNPAAPDGLLVVDKPQGMTSHDVVSRVRRLAHTRKVGHAGTLDPMATGVLVVGIGQATRLLTWVSGHDKAYEATVRLGIATTTDDAEGEVLASPGCATLTAGRLEEALAPLRGEIWQVPSSVSAVKIDGKRAYARVRQGETVEIPARRVRVGRLDLLAPPRPGQAAGADGVPTDVVDVDVHVECSSGTYVRALARDLGEALGCGAHLTALRRSRVGTFTLGAAHPLDALERSAEDGEVLPVVPLDDAVRALFPVLVLDAEEAGSFAHGQAPRRDAAQVEALSAAAGEGPLAVLDPDGVRVLGLARVDEGAGTLRTVLVWGERP